MDSPLQVLADCSTIIVIMAALAAAGFKAEEERENQKYLVQPIYQESVPATYPEEDLIPVFPQAFQEAVSTTRIENVVKTILDEEGNAQVFHVIDKQLNITDLVITIPEQLTRRDKPNTVFFDVSPEEPSYAKQIKFSHGEELYEVHLHDHTEFEVR